MATFRDILGPVFGAEALARAEGRTYTPGVAGFACADGYCAAGVIARDWPGWVAPYDALPAGHYARRYTCPDMLGFKRPSRVRTALWRVITASDRGELAWPGALTAVLDAEYDKRY